MIQSRNTCNACGVSCTQLRLKESLELWAKYLTHRYITIVKWKNGERRERIRNICDFMLEWSRALNIICVNERGRWEGDTNAKVQRTSHSIGEKGRERIYVNDRRRRKRSRLQRSKENKTPWFFFIYTFISKHTKYSLTHNFRFLAKLLQTFTNSIFYIDIDI